MGGQVVTWGGQTDTGSQAALPHHGGERVQGNGGTMHLGPPAAREVTPLPVPQVTPPAAPCSAPAAPGW